MDSKADSTDQKLFYRIGELVKLLDIPSSMLRFWEKEFDCLKQLKKNRKGERMYTLKNIEDIKSIIYLVKTKGYTLQGANDFMKKDEDKINKNQQAYNSLNKIKSFLEELKENL
ncbi:MAG: MerR family transcriptional regulator [bacterium]|nr:MerR family transcriptional regulator [bacterium]